MYHGLIWLSSCIRSFFVRWEKVSVNSVVLRDDEDRCVQVKLYNVGACGFSKFQVGFGETIFKWFVNVFGVKSVCQFKVCYGVSIHGVSCVVVDVISVSRFDMVVKFNSVNFCPMVQLIRTEQDSLNTYGMHGACNC